MPLGLQVALQGSHGQAPGAGAHQVDLAAAGDGPADIHGFFQGFDVARQAPFTMARVGVAPADHEGLQAILEHVLHEAVGRAQVEDVELVDLWRYHQHRPGVLFLAHRFVLDQLQQLAAKHYCTWRGGQVAADLEGMRIDLARQAIVVAQVIDQVVQTAHQAQAA
ncbi:hypothetical protein D3C81_884420 [compost metagenome]